jgi:hypothetical protein
MDSERWTEEVQSAMRIFPLLKCWNAQGRRARDSTDGLEESHYLADIHTVIAEVIRKGFTPQQARLAIQHHLAANRLQVRSNGKLLSPTALLWEWMKTATAIEPNVVASDDRRKWKA